MFSPGLDGNQVLDFYWTDPIDAMKCSVSKLQYKDKLYTTFKPGMSITEPMVRAFDEANSGMVFQSAYLVDTSSSPLLALFYADASFFWTKHDPSPHLQYVIIDIKSIIVIISLIAVLTVCLLNLHEDERLKPRNWVPVGWIPVYDESRDKRPGTGFDSTSARKYRLYHACWIEFLDKWAERTKDPILIPWADGKTRWTRLFIGGVLGDQQEGDKYTGEPCVCHRCFAPRDQYLSTADFEVKIMRKVRQRVEIAAAGGYMKGIRDKRVVRWDPDCRNVRAGPGIKHIIFIMSIMRIIRIIFVLSGARFYESQRKKAGAHLFFNAFWLIPHFCINLMYMRDTMHQIDSGVIISFLKAILRKFRESVEIPLGIAGAAAKKLTNRLHRLLGKEKTTSGQIMHGAHACLVTVNYTAARQEESCPKHTFM